jgi:hypothetical protein
MFAAVYKNAGQVGLVDSDVSGNTSQVAPPIVLSTSGRGTSLAVFANSVNDVDVSWNGATEQIEENASSSYYSIAEQLTDGSNVTFTPSASPINNNCMVAIAIKGSAQTAPVGLASEADTGQTVATQRVEAVGMAAETDTAFAVVADTGQTVAVGLASEADTANDVTPVEPGKVPVGLASETDTALEVRPAVGLDVGLSSETNSAQAVTFRREVIVGLAVETDQAIRVTSPSQAAQEALARRNDSGTVGLAVQMAAEAKRMGDFRRGIEREEDELLAVMPAVVRILLNLTR